LRAMLKLLRWDNLQMVARHPERVDPGELTAICHQIFLVQGTLGVVSFVPAAYSHTLGLETVLNVVIPWWGFYSTKEVDPENYRPIRIAAVYWVLGAVFGLLQCIFSLDYRALPRVLLKTGISIVQWIAFARLWRILLHEKMTKARFYLNIVVLNKKEVVNAGVQKKTGLEGRGLGRLAGVLANCMVTDDKFGANLGKRLEEMIPRRMEEQGIKAKAALEFKRGNLVVMLVTVKSVDMRTLVAKKLGDDKANKFNKWHEFLPRSLQREFEDFVISRLAAGLMTKLPENVAEKMKEMGGMEVAAEAKTPEEEAEYLFKLLAQLDQTDAEPQEEK